MGTFFIPALAVFLVATVIVMVIARRKDPRPSRAYTAISVLAAIALTLLVMREFIMSNAVISP